MDSTETHETVATDIGDMSVVDFGGTGVDALMFHSPGFCAESLSLVAWGLRTRCHAYSVELPGHGQSPADGVGAADLWPVIPQIAAGLGLDRPLLVGFDMSGFLVAAAAARHPEAARGVVCVGAWCLRTRAETAEFLDFLTSDDVMGGVAERMLLGATSPDEAGMRRILAVLARNAIHDFLIADEESRFADRIACTIGRTPDGEYVRLPTVATMHRLYGLDPGAAVYPEEALLHRLDMPCLLVLTTDGLDADLIDRGHSLATRKQNVQVEVIESGNNPQMSDPELVANAVARFAARLPVETSA